MPSNTLNYTADRIAEIADQLFDLHDTQMSKPRTENGWSRKEILGHLIDSALVNHQRIIQSKLNNSIIFTGYNHQQWVTINQYQSTDWEELVTLWCALNIQLSTMIDHIPQETLDNTHTTHSYATTAYRPLPNDQPSTLGYLIEDYFAHLHHHLNQITT